MGYNRRPPNRGQQRRPYQRSNNSTRTDRTETFVQKKNLDINCNVGQGFGIYQNQFEEKLLPYVTSINIACGAHAGDPLTMTKVIDLAKNYNVSIGALIGFDDRVGNGEREIYLGVEELRAMVLYQLGALHALLHSKGMEIKHVRTHGFLYKQLYTDVLIAETVAKAVGEFSRWITLVGLSGSVLTTACTNANIRAGHEVQVARRYRKDGTILPFTTLAGNTKNLIESSADKARELIQTGRLTCDDNSKIRVNVDTIHIPSDDEQSLELARLVRAMIPDPKPLHTDQFDKYLAGTSVLN